MNLNIEGVASAPSGPINLTSTAPSPLIQTTPEAAQAFLFDFIQKLNLPDNFEEIELAQPPKKDVIDSLELPEPARKVLNNALKEFGNSLKMLQGFLKSDAYILDCQPNTRTGFRKLLSTVFFTEKRAEVATLVDRFTAITMDYGLVVRSWVDFALETELLVRIALSSAEKAAEGSYVEPQAINNIKEKLLRKYDESEGLVNALEDLERALSELDAHIDRAEDEVRVSHSDARDSTTLLSADSLRRSLIVIGIVPVIGAVVGLAVIPTHNDDIMSLGAMISSGILGFFYNSIWKERVKAFKTADNVTTNDIKKLIDQVRPATRSLQKSIIDYTATIKAKRDLIQGEPLAQPELESRRWKTIHKEYEEFSNHAQEVKKLFQRFNLWDRSDGLIPFLGTVGNPSEFGE